MFFEETVVNNAFFDEDDFDSNADIDDIFFDFSHIIHAWIDMDVDSYLDLLNKQLKKGFGLHVFDSECVGYIRTVYSIEALRSH